jgi:hypothetical protein
LEPKYFSHVLSKSGEVLLDHRTLWYPLSSPMNNIDKNQYKEIEWV